MANAKPYSPDDLAERWNVTGKHIRDLCHKGTLSFFKVGKLYRIPASVVEAYEQGGEWTTGSKSTQDIGQSSGTTGRKPDADALQGSTKMQPSAPSRILKGPGNQIVVTR